MPKLVITAPAAGSTIVGGTANVTYTTTGNLTGVDHVHFQIDEEPVKMDLSLDGGYTFSGIHVGSHTLNGWLVRADHTKISGSDAMPVGFSNVVDLPISRHRPSRSRLPQPAQRGGSGLDGRRSSRQCRDLRGAVRARRSAARRRGPDRAYASTGTRRRSATSAHLDGDRPRRCRNETTSAPVTVTVANTGATRHRSGRWAAPPRCPSSRFTRACSRTEALIFDSDKATWNPQVGIPCGLTQVRQRAEPLLRRPHADAGRATRRGGHIELRGHQGDDDLRPVADREQVQPMTSALVPTPRSCRWA